MFSMFPSGRPGIALLLLRLSVAALPIIGASTRLAQSVPHWALAGLILASLMISLGFLTSMLSGVCCFTAVAGLVGGGSSDVPLLFLSILNAGALALLGPGAYSLDVSAGGRTEES